MESEDAARADITEPQLEAWEPLETVGQLVFKIPEAKAQAARAGLATQSRSKLASLLRKAIQGRRRASVWLINQEYSRRGVPPVFRDELVVNYDDPELLMDSLAVDLEWIATTYPLHVTFYQRWSRFVSAPSFHSQVRYIFNSVGRGKRSLYRAIKGLALSADQQRECHYLSQECYLSQVSTLRAARETTEANLREKHQTRVRRRLLAEDYDIVARKVNVWFCANLGGWKPTRTASLYNALTGNPDGAVKSMTRQQAHNVMNDLIRDLNKKECRLW